MYPISISVLFVDVSRKAAKLQGIHFHMLFFASWRLCLKLYRLWYNMRMVIFLNLSSDGANHAKQ